MSVKVAIVGAYIRFTFTGGGTASYSRSDRFIIEVTAHNYISIYSISQSDFARQNPYRIIKQTLFSDITYDNGTPIGATPQDVIDYFSGVFSLGVGFLYSADNYSALQIEAPPGPTIPALSLAYVRSPQGTAWLPGTIGGTYYDRGIYLYDGTAWVSNRNDIAAALQILIADVDEIDSRIDTHDTRLDSIDDMITAIDLEIADHETRITGLETQITNLTTTNVPEGTRQYFTTARVLATLLSGLNTALTGTILSTDTILIAFGKIQNSITAHVNNTANPHAVTKTQVGLSNVPNIDATNPSNITQDATHRFATDAEKTTWNAKQNAIGYTPENLANKNQASGYAGLDAGGLIPVALLPSYVDDVLEFANLAAFPAVGESGKMYVALDTGRVYRWSGSIYVRIANPGTTDDVIEGSLNFYFTTARVLATLLAGLSLATGTAITSADSILVAMGKLQKQITDLAALVPTATQKAALVGNNGAPGAANRYVTESGLAAAFTQVGANVVRAVNTVASVGFLVSATKYSYVRYVIGITCSVSLSGSQTGDVFIETAPTGTAAGGAWTAIDQGGFAWAGGLVIGLTLNPTLRVSIAGFIPPNYDVRIRFAGTGSVVYVSGRENILN